MRISESRVRIVGWALAALGLAGGVVVGYLMSGPSRELVERSSGGKKMTSLQLAFEAQRAEWIIKDWRGDEPPPFPDTDGKKATARRPVLAEARKNLSLDAWLIPFYVALLTGLCLVLSGAYGKWRDNPWLVLAALPAVAGALDYQENALLAQEIDLVAAGGVLGGRLPLAVGLVASLKFLLLGIVFLALLIVGIALFRAWLAGALRPPPKQAWVPLEGAIAAERAYLAGRRRWALSEAEAAAGQRPVGLAFSGGGIRAATVCLGAMRALSKLEVLPRVDYLSTVSGGGYIGSALSSLLSINRRTAQASAHGLDDQYRFRPGDKALLTTQAERFPFEPDRNLQEELRKDLGGRYDGRVQLGHLRTHGDFLIRTKRLIHRDVLRTVGTVLGGIFYHLLMGFLVLALVSSAYLIAVWLMADSAIGSAPENLLGQPEFATYWRQLFDFGDGSARPFFLAIFVGLVALPTAMALCSLIWFLPERWFRRSGDTVEENREYHSLWALFTITLLAAIAVTNFVIEREGYQLANITLPMGVYVGGWLASLILHAVVAVSPSFGRNQRSRFAAWKGIFNYLTAISVLVILVPFVLAWINKDASRSSVFANWPAKESLAWLASLFGSGWLAKGALGQAASGAAGGGGRLAAIKKLPGTLRNLLLGFLVTVLVVVGLVLVTAFLLRWELVAGLDPDPLSFRLGVLGAALLAFLLLGWAIDFNKLSLHFFYRDRLVEAYLQTEGQVPPDAPAAEVPGSLDLLRDNGEMRLVQLHGVREEPQPATRGPAAARTAPAAGSTALPRDLNLVERALQALPFGPAARTPGELAPVEAVTGAPLHLIVTCLNLTRSRDMTRRSRKSDTFVFSKLFCGSDTTGYMDTRLYRSGETKLARAMAASGAAANTAMGFHTFFAQAMAMTLFNVRLGQWFENPRFRNGARAHRREGWVFWPGYLWQEVRGASDASHRLVHLSDGAHTGDNLGLYPLLQRRCRLIVSCDAEADPDLCFGSFTEVVRQVEIDLGIRIDIELGAIRPDKATGFSTRPFALGRITYPEDKERGIKQEGGWLLLIKASLCGCESETLRTYKSRHPAFPHETTLDQFFDDAQFEAYRELGESMMERALGKELWELLRAKPEWFRKWRKDLGEVLPTSS